MSIIALNNLNNNAPAAPAGRHKTLEGRPTS
jgi:hypothetical protein